MNKLKEVHDLWAKPVSPFALVIGGGSVEEKLAILERFSSKMDRLFVGGSLGLVVLKSMGLETGRASIEPGFSRLVEDSLREAKRRADVRLPEDFMIRDGDSVRCLFDTQLRPMDEPVDIGTHSLAQIENLLEGARTILWIDSFAISNAKRFNASDYALAQWFHGRITSRWQRATLIGDGLLTSLSSAGVLKQLQNTTLFGDAAIYVQAGWPLPAVQALDGKTAEARNNPPKRVLIPVDGSESSLATAERLAEHLGVEKAEIFLLYVHCREGKPGRDSWRDSDDIERIHAEARVAARPIFSAVDAELARHGLAARHHIVREGDPADEILTYADEMHADLIVIGMHERPAMLRFLLRSVSQKVINNARCPVLIARVSDKKSEEAGTLAA